MTNKLRTRTAPYRCVVKEKTRHGKTIYYYRKGNGPRIRLHGKPGSLQFRMSYEDAANGIETMNQELAATHSATADVARVVIANLKGVERRAAAKRLKFELTEEWVLETAKKQRGRCALTGMDFVIGPLGRGRNPLGPSLDRINSMEGYTPENTRIVLLAANVMLSDWGEELFAEIANAYSSFKRIRDTAS